MGHNREPDQQVELRRQTLQLMVRRRFGVPRGPPRVHTIAGGEMLTWVLHSLYLHGDTRKFCRDSITSKLREARSRLYRRKNWQANSKYSLESS